MKGRSQDVKRYDGLSGVQDSSWPFRYSRASAASLRPPLTLHQLRRKGKI